MDIIRNPQSAAQLIIGLFIAITFLQSGVDKVIDWKGNMSWLQGHFDNTFLASMVKPMLAFITLAELATGLLAVYGVVCLIFCDDSSCIYYALLTACGTLLMLLFGQRISKDYTGAQTVVVYLCACLIGMVFF